MRGICKKCGYMGEMHQVGIPLNQIAILMDIELHKDEENFYLTIIQCPDCCFNHSIKLVKKERD